MDSGFKRSIRKIKFKYELYDRKGEFKKELDNILSFRIQHNFFSQLKTTARISMLEDSEIDFMNDFIKPYVLISQPSEPVVEEEREVVFLNLTHPVETEIINEGVYGEWEEYPLGAFYMSSPTRRDENNKVVRDIEAYDLTLTLSEDKITERYTVTKGSNYIEEIKRLLNNSGVNNYRIESPDVVTTRRDIEYEPGTSLLTIVNDMLGQIGNTPIYMDNMGILRSYKYVNPADRMPTKFYDDSSCSVVLEGSEEELDIFNVPNVFSVAVSNPDELPIIRTVVNDDPSNVLSTVRRGRRIVDFRTIEDMSNEDSLERYVMRIANEANTQYGTIKFRTPIVLGHWYGEVVKFKYSPLQIEGTFLESGWEMDLKVGGEMTHTLRKVVNFSPEKLTRGE